MDVKPARLRLGEWVAGGAAACLLALMLAVHWYGRRTGWQVLAGARWAVAVTAAAAFVLVYTQATRPAPAVPVTMSLFVTVIGALTTLWLLYRVAISPPPHAQLGAWLGLICAGATTAGAFLSMRQEGIYPGDAPHEIPVVALPAARGGAGAPD